MTVYRGALLGLLAIIATALILLVIRISPTANPELSREEKLRIACEGHPSDCVLMKQSRANAEAVMRDAMRFPSPEAKAAVDRLENDLREYEDNFIATGIYGEPTNRV